MPAVAVGGDFEDARFKLVAGQGEVLVGLFPHGVEIVAVAGVPGHVVAGGALRERQAGRGALLARAHRVAVVLDDEDHRQVPERGEVERLVHGALVDGAVAHERKAGALAAEVFQAEREAGPERDLAADDAVATPEIARWIEKMHGTALALGTAGDPAVELGHEGIEVHAHGNGVAVVAIRRDHLVVLLHHRAATDGDRFLADVEMKEPADLAGLVGAQAAFLEAADAHERPVKTDALLCGQPGVDRRLGGLALSAANGEVRVGPAVAVDSLLTK